MESAGTGLRWARATTVATAATLVAVGAHLGGGGESPTSPVLAFLVPALTAALAPFLTRSASRLRVVLLTVGGQFVAHTTLALATVYDGAGTASHITSGGDPGGAHHARASSASWGSMPSQLSEHVFAADHRMLLAHTTAAAVVGLWLAAGERAVWTLVRLIWRALVLPLLPLPSSRPPASATVSPAVGTMLPRIAADSVVRRGPPHLLAS